MRFPSPSQHQSFMRKPQISRAILFSNRFVFKSWKLQFMGKIDRKSLSNTNVLIVGTGNIGTKVVQKLKNFVRISTFDMISNTSELKEMIQQADCIATIFHSLNQ